MKRHHWLALQGGMRFRRPQPCQGPLNTTDCGQFRQGISEHEDLVRLIGDPRSSIEVIPRYVILKTHHIAMELRAPAVSVGEPEFDRTRRPVSGTEQLVCPPDVAIRRNWPGNRSVRIEGEATQHSAIVPDSPEPLRLPPSPSAVPVTRV
jgi:hypothetical protein